MKTRKVSVMGRAATLARARTRLIALALLVTCLFGMGGTTHAAGQSVEVKYPASTAENALLQKGEKTTWHGFDRYDFVMDDQTFLRATKDQGPIVDFIIGFAGLTAPTQPAKSAKPAFDKNSPYYFDGTISRQTLENYLDRANTMGYFLVPGQPERYQFPYRDDDVRMIHNLGAKLVGRAIYRWSEESKLGDPAFLEYAKKMVDTVHANDPEVIFQGCLFENVSGDVNKLKIPAWVFTDFGLPVEDRTFDRAEDHQTDRQGRPRRRADNQQSGNPALVLLPRRLLHQHRL